MPTFRSGDARLSYEIAGAGPDVILMHPFPLNRHFWDLLRPVLVTEYRLILPDLRAHGESELGEGAVTMRQLADDLVGLCREEKIRKAFFVGVSIGGYLFFEFWRRHRDHVAALVLANTRPGAETSEGRASRLQLADQVLREGTASFIEEMLAKLLSQTTRTNRPDIVEAARKMMQSMSAEDIAAVQRGMAERSDSVATLSTIHVPTLIIAGDDDSIPGSEFERMQQQIRSSRLQVISQAGHYAALEKPAEFGSLLRTFFDGLPRY